MPVTGINKNLENMLDILFSTNGLKGWQIFEDRSGCVVAKLRFGANHGHGSMDRVSPG